MKPRSSKRTWDILTSADDTTLVLNRNYKPDLMITGTGVLQVYDLGDARTYPLNNGRTSAYRNIYNGTPEFIGVINSDGTVFHRVPPRASCECVLMDNSTAAGVWWSQVVESGDPGYGWSRFFDFEGNSSGTSGVLSGSINLAQAASGASASINNNAATATSYNGKQGTLILTTGTTIAGYALAYHSLRGSYLGSGCRAVEYLQSLSAISSAADEYIARFGLGDNLTGGAHNNGVYFLYDRFNGGGAPITTWQIRNINGAGNTTVSTAVAPAYDTTGATWQKLRLEVDSAAARSDFWIDRVQVSAAGGLAANVPTTATALPIAHFGITKTEDAGVNARYIRSDYLWMQSYPAALR